MLQVDLQQSRLAQPATLRVLRQRIEDYIDNNLEHSRLTVAAIAQRMGCSPRYVYRAFEEGSTTLATYLWHSRLQRAWVRLLSENTESISDIAFSVGFSSSAHFSRAFKDRYGLAPSELRRRVQIGTY